MDTAQIFISFLENFFCCRVLYTGAEGSAGKDPPLEDPLGPDSESWTAEPTVWQYRSCRSWPLQVQAGDKYQ